MIEFLTDHWSDFILYTTYASMVLQFLLIVSYHWMETHAIRRHSYTLAQISPDFEKKDILTMEAPGSKLITWISKTIRRKDNRRDDVDEHYILSLLSE